MKYVFKVALLLSMSFALQVYAQQNSRNFNYIFSSDSIAGFDELQARQNALQGSFFGEEYKVYMYVAKRQFVNAKYNIKNSPASSPGKGIGYQYSNNKPLAAPCVNEDFETGTVSGWTVTSQSLNNNSCAYNPCATAGSPEITVVSTPLTDTYIGTLPNSPLGGTQVVKLNDNSPSGLVTRIAQTFPVTANNSLFQFAYAAVFEGAHACCDNPFLNINLKNCGGAVLACPQVTVVAPGGSCPGGAAGFTGPNSSGISYNASWQVHSLDLTSYVGSCVTIEVTVGDCDAAGHFGYAYFDALCAPMTVTVNNVPFPVGTNASTVSACAATATVSAPPGLAPYSWNGPPGSGITNNTNQTFTSTTSGNYVLTMNPAGSCAPVTRTINLLFGTPPTAGFTSANTCNNFTFTNTGSAAPATQTYTFNGVNAPASFTTSSATSQVLFPSSGTFTVTQIVSNVAGCIVTHSAIVSVPTLPDASFSTPNFTQCLSGNSFVFTATNGSGTHTYAFNPAAGAPSNGNTATYGPVSFSSANTFTVDHTIVTGGCSNTTSSVVLINPAPTVNASNNGPLCNGNALVLTTTNTASSYQWSGPNGFTSTLQSPGLPAVSLADAGTYNLTITDLNGCTGSGSTILAVILPSIAVGNTGPYCSGESIFLNSTAALSYTWTGPNGFTDNNQNPVIPNSSSIMTGNYAITASFGSCVLTGTTTVIVNPSPTVNISSGPNTGCVPICVSFNAQSSPTSNSFNWNLANGSFATGLSAQTCYDVAGIYTVTANTTDQNGCFGEATYTVEPYPIPVADFNHSPIKPIINIDADVKFTDASYNANVVSWNWYFMNTTEHQSIMQNPTFLYQDPGDYVVALVVKSDHGCVDTIIRTLEVGEDFGIYVPNTFTPNGDGLNDIFQPKGFGITKYHLQVFDRWGERVFESNEFEKGWDGKFQGKGKICANDIYTWKIDVTSVFFKSHQYTGHITLIK